MECKAIAYRTEQFRATRFWNSIVTTVREKLPVRRHRKGLKHFNDCFSGDEAVSWTLHYLNHNKEILLGTMPYDEESMNPVAQTEITREKVTLLLQKFIEQKIIEDVRGRGGPFKDSSRQLYTFHKENVASRSTFTTTVATFKENCCDRKNQTGSLGHISPPAIKSATTLVKVALVGLSSQKRRETSSTVRT
ncbi:DEP domain-containing protein 1A-like [Tropilaelaps mercedesae]|uniref:DEP domain-containing protein 1A-like n=1 Tax=Tropilaelaps mercedesae TaxID=418985 RepID=A0A1V9X491_9ACAR|nr:DEP domain-containing protein 1A-like [Tropilaelaps mercedesae]